MSQAIEPQMVLQARHLHKQFGGVVALEDVNLDVKAHQILGIMGSNGAGKTTTLDVISGFTKADQGMVVLDGVNITQVSPATRAARGLGRTFQDVRLVPSLTVAEMLAVSLDSEHSVGGALSCMVNLPVVWQAQDQVGERVDRLLETFGLGRYRDMFISELSTGTRRAVELACASARNPTVILLDEPSSGLAQAESEAMAQVLLDLRDATGAALVVIEHDVPLLTSIADELVCMHLGRVISQGAPADVIADPAVVASYLGTNPDAIFRSGQVNAPAGRPATPARAAARSELAEVTLSPASFVPLPTPNRLFEVVAMVAAIVLAAGVYLWRNEVPRPAHASGAAVAGQAVAAAPSQSPSATPSLTAAPPMLIVPPPAVVTGAPSFSAPAFTPPSSAEPSPEQAPSPSPSPCSVGGMPLPTAPPTPIPGVCP